MPHPTGSFTNRIDLPALAQLPTRSSRPSARSSTAPSRPPRPQSHPHHDTIPNELDESPRTPVVASA